MLSPEERSALELCVAELTARRDELDNAIRVIRRTLAGDGRPYAVFEAEAAPTPAPAPGPDAGNGPEPAPPTAAPARGEADKAARHRLAVARLLAKRGPLRHSELLAAVASGELDIPSTAIVKGVALHGGWVRKGPGKRGPWEVTAEGRAALAATRPG